LVKGLTMKLVSAGNQQVRHFLYDSSGTITTGGSAQLVLARSMARSFLYLKNTSVGPLWFETDGPRATATISGGVVTSVSITNAGFNMTLPPLIRFLGGGQGGAGYNQPPNTSYLGLGQPNGPTPPNQATGIPVMGGSGANKNVSSITVNNAGSNYVIAPYVQIITSDLDPYGCAIPSTGVGIMLSAGESIMWNGTCCPTEAIAVFGATTGQGFICKWMD
jgi:hypothetical protein